MIDSAGRVRYTTLDPGGLASCYVLLVICLATYLAVLHRRSWLPVACSAALLAGAVMLAHERSRPRSGPEAMSPMWRAWLSLRGLLIGAAILVSNRRPG